MVISFTPSHAFVYGVTHTEADRSEVGQPLKFEVGPGPDSVIVLNNVADGRVRVVGLPGNVIYLTDSVAVTGREPISVQRERVLVFMLEDGSDGPVRVERVPADWDTEDCERYTGGSAGDGLWDRCALVDLEEVKEEE
jgi:hypothetical protein